VVSRRRSTEIPGFMFKGVRARSWRSIGRAESGASKAKDS